jgi:hypothetical protein
VLVRNAIDSDDGTTAADERRGAVEEIAAMAGRHLPPEDLEALIDAERDRLADDAAPR